MLSSHGLRHIFPFVCCRSSSSAKRVRIVCIIICSNPPPPPEKSPSHRKNKVLDRGIFASQRTMLRQILCPQQNLVTSTSISLRHTAGGTAFFRDFPTLPHENASNFDNLVLPAAQSWPHNPWLRPRLRELRSSHRRQHLLGSQGCPASHEISGYIGT